MSVTLTPELERLVHDKVQSGEYLTADEVVREALRLLDQRDRIRQLQREELRKQLAVGLEQADRGEVLDGVEVFRKLREKFPEASSEQGA